MIKTVDEIENRAAVGPSAQMDAALQQLAEGTETLNTYFPDNRALRAAIRDYTASVDQILSATDTPPAVKRTQLAAPEPRRLLRQMLSASFSLCGSHSYLMLSAPRPGASAPTDLTTSGIRGGFSAWKAELSAYAALVIVTLIILGGTFYLFRKRGRRAKRFMCNISASVQLGDTCFQTRVFDISAKGAKIKLPDYPIPSQEATMTVGGIKIAAKLTWQNGHFAGVVFQNPLVMSVVRSLVRNK
ncbi:PilZ domain-containing protein [Pseudooctadecabacter sp.]|uniref:PilZ domain-containing protein n=1 Tax=Pseudooctadecabacter sp. TaxID=1966338 RepID=UPI0035C83BD3